MAGKQKGMKKGSGTRSGLLWEVERLLNECEELPQVLLMENVPQVHSQDNMSDFQKWIDFLTSKGYSNYWQDLNARDFGVAQNRNRCFMVSILGEYNYKFPKPSPLDKTMKDYLMDEVDDKYYITNEKAKKLIDTLILDGNIVYDENGLSPCICAGMGVKQQPTMIVDAKSLRMVRTEEGKAIRKAYESGEVHHGFNEFRTAEPREDGVSNTITTVLKDNMILEQRIVAMRGRNPENPSDRTPGIETEQRLEVNSEGICNTLTSVQKDNLVLEVRKEIDPRYHNFLYEIDGELYLIRIRKLIPRECWRLMNFTDEDFDKAASVNSNTQLYKQAGNSIVKAVMMAIFRQML